MVTSHHNKLYLFALEDDVDDNAVAPAVVDEFGPPLSLFINDGIDKNIYNTNQYHPREIEKMLNADEDDSGIMRI